MEGKEGRESAISNLKKKADGMLDAQASRFVASVIPDLIEEINEATKLNKQSATISLKCENRLLLYWDVDAKWWSSMEGCWVPIDKKSPFERKEALIVNIRNKEFKLHEKRTCQQLVDEIKIRIESHELQCNMTHKRIWKKWVKKGESGNIACYLSSIRVVWD